MPIEMRTHGYNWKRVLREQDVFCALVTPAWHSDPFMQRQYAYARELGMSIYLLVQQGTPLPTDADAHAWYAWRTTDELADLVARVEKGTLDNDLLRYKGYICGMRRGAL